MKLKKNLALLFHRIYEKDQEVQNFEDVEIQIFKKTIELLSSDKLSKYNYYLTFDDGFVSDYTIAYKELSKLNLSATFFIVPKLIGLKGYLDWNMIKEMSDNSMRFGSHSLTHCDLTKADFVSAKNELEGSKSFIEDKIGKEVNEFSFPFGRYNNSLAKLVKETGYRHVYYSKHGIFNENDFLKSRNSINSIFTIKKIRSVLSAGAVQKINWYLEDNVKYTLKNLIGDDKYKLIRSKLIRLIKF